LSAGRGRNEHKTERRQHRRSRLIAKHLQQGQRFRTPGISDTHQLVYRKLVY